MKKKYCRPETEIVIAESFVILAGSGVDTGREGDTEEGGSMSKRGWFDEYDEPSGEMNLWEGLEDRLDDGI